MLEIMKTGKRNSWKWSAAIIDRNKIYPVSKAGTETGASKTIGVAVLCQV
jgi:hypothetical protein